MCEAIKVQFKKCTVGSLFPRRHSHMKVWSCCKCKYTCTHFYIHQFMYFFHLAGHSDVVMGAICTNNEVVFKKLKYLHNCEFS